MNREAKQQVKVLWAKKVEEGKEDQDDQDQRKDQVAEY